MTADTMEEVRAVRMERKRHISDVVTRLSGLNALKEKAAKKSKTVTNGGWGEKFKNRDDFLDAHLC